MLADHTKQRRMATVFAALIALASTSPVVAQSQDEGAKAPVLSFIGSLESLDVDLAMASFADDATAFFPHAAIADRLQGHEEIRAMMEVAFRGGRARAAEAGVHAPPFQTISIADMHVQDVAENIAVVTWHAHDERRKARRTAVVERRDGRWLMVSLHSSNIWLTSTTSASTEAPASTPTPRILEDPTRLPADRDRDAGSRPLDVYAWLGLREGQTVGDLVPFSGYNTHLLSRVVGPRGRVLAVFNIARQQEALEQRLGGADLANVTVAPDLSTVPAASVDAYVTVRNIHDFFIPEVVDGAGLTPREEVFGEVLRTLKPGGILGVVDSRTARAGVDAETHRINEQFVVRELEAFGFEFVDGSALLANPDDDHATAGFPDRWNVDRFLLKFRKRS